MPTTMPSPSTFLHLCVYFSWINFEPDHSPGSDYCSLINAFAFAYFCAKSWILGDGFAFGEHCVAIHPVRHFIPDQSAGPMGHSNP